jgi:predicted alpha-1,2-mannosidase
MHPSHLCRAVRHVRPPVRRFPAVLGLAASAGLGGLLVLSSTPAMASPAFPAATAAAAAVSNPASLVNPFIGTTNQGNDFPGADAPFGMVQWSPDTTSRPPGGGYEYNDSAITGFSLDHLSGPGCGADGDVPVLPTVGAVNTSATDSFSHSNETASAGSYKVALDNGVTTALTATAHTGMAQFTFPATTQANLIFKLDGSQQGDSATSFTVVSSTEVEGSVTSANFCGPSPAWTVNFDMRFNVPFATNGTFDAAGIQPGVDQQTVKQSAATAAPKTVSPSTPEVPNEPVYHGAPSKADAAVTPALTGPSGTYLTFNTTSNQTVLAKVGVSFVSIANAASNLNTENSGWNFAATQSADQTAWNNLLGKVAISGGTSDQQVQFYTALYHALLHPNVYSDDNGQYTGEDGKVHTVDAGHSAFYTNFSGWDIYRSQAQLEALLDPTAASDTAQSMLDDYAQGGQLPKWLLNDGENQTMVGDPADPIIADYYAFGAHNFDTSTALSDMVAEATTANNNRPGLNYLTAPGYMPHDGTYNTCCNFYGPVSTTLEYNTADFAISAFAQAVGNSTDQATFRNRAQDWRNVLNPNSGFVQPRNADGTWVGGFDPTSGTDMVEATSWIYSGMVPFDLAGLTAAKGGATAMNEYLNRLLSSYTGADGLAWVGNEPSIELPWEYDYTGEPYQTQETVRQIQDQIWSNTPAGLADGNDDLGTMSAWYVWSALGMYPETPGTSDLALGSPMFTQAVITLPSGNTLTINGNGAADNAPYVQSATWNGGAWNNAYAPTSAITSGGTLNYTLGTSANTSWAAGAAAAPPSYPGNDVTPTSPRVGPVTSGVAADICVDDNASSSTDGTVVQTWGCDGTAAQSWNIAADGTIRTLGKCLDVIGGGTTAGTKVDLWTCNGGANQQWAPGANSSLVNPSSGLCLDDPASNTANGTQLEIWTCNGGSNQQWNLPAAPHVRAGAIASGEAGLCADDAGGSGANGTHIQTYTCNGTPAQSWTMASDGTLRTEGGCMDVTGGGTANGTLIQLYTCNGTGAQQWQATTAGQLINPASGRCLDIPNASTANSTQLEIWDCNNGTNQKWTMPS